MSQRSRYMTQLRYPVSTCAAQWKMWLFKVFGVIYMVAVCASQDNDATTYSYQQSESTPPPFEPPVPDLQRTSSWPDVFTSEKVGLKCSATSSSELIFTWKKDGRPLPSVPNLSQSLDTSVLTITATSTQDSGSYTCVVEGKKKPSQTKESSPVKIEVYASKPKPTLTQDPKSVEMFSGESITFTCSVDVSSGWEYLWYHGLNQIAVANTKTYTQSSVTTQNSGQYYCKGKRSPFLTDSSESTTLSVIEIPVPTITERPQWTQVFPTESVKFKCGMRPDSYKWVYTWFRDGKQILADGTVSFDANGAGLSISSASAGHIGKYKCSGKIQDRAVTSQTTSELSLSVYAEKPTLTLTRDPDYQVMFVGESVTFSCAISVQSEWTYLWYKDGSQLTGSSDKLVVQIQGTANGGSYTCKATRGQNPAFTTDLSTAKQLNVQAEKPTLTLTRDPDYQVMFVGESVTFSCAISVQSEWTYLWYKDGSQLTGSSDKLVVQIQGTANGGSYTCKATRVQNPAFTTDLSTAKQLNVQENKPKPLMTQQPDAKKLYFGENVSFECKVENSDGWSYDWYKDEKSIFNNSNSLKMKGLNLSNTGAYKCKAKREKTEINTEFSDQRTLKPSEIPVPTLKLVTKWADVFPTESVNMSCGMEQEGADWTYAFYRDETKVQDYNSKKDRNLSITSASASNSGSYRCSGKLKSRDVYSINSSSLNLHVYDAKPTVTLEQNPAHILMYSDEPVSFNCHVNVSSGWKYLWYKDLKDLGSSGSNHNIISVATKDSGSYKCKVRRGTDVFFSSDHSNAVALKVQERPKATIVLLTGWSEVFSTDSLILKCEVKESMYTWDDYAWFKEGKEINDSSTEKHAVTPNNDPDQSTYTCRGLRGERPLRSKFSDSFKTKNLLLKRRVLLSISGCIVFGIAAVLIGCVALRVFRKPNGHHAKMEEVSLFPTMAELKITDVPCPLVEYITDASLNAPAKAEEEENGTVCSETTPLPITTQDDQAAATDNQETTETNGGLSSFQK